MWNSFQFSTKIPVLARFHDGAFCHYHLDCISGGICQCGLAEGDVISVHMAVQTAEYETSTPASLYVKREKKASKMQPPVTSTRRCKNSKL